MICGRCGGGIQYAGSEGDLDWYVCSTCDNTVAEHDPVYNFDISLRKDTTPHLPRNKRKRKFFNP